MIAALASIHRPRRGRAAAAAVVDLSSPAGHWQPIDSSTGKPLGLIKIYEDQGLFFGRIEPSSLADNNGRRCSNAAVIATTSRSSDCC